MRDQIRKGLAIQESQDPFGDDNYDQFEKIADHLHSKGYRQGVQDHKTGNIQFSHKNGHAVNVSINNDWTHHDGKSNVGKGSGLSDLQSHL